MSDANSRKEARPGTFLEEGPIADPLTRRFRVTIVLTLVPAVIGSMMFAIFTAFGRPDVGGILVGILFVPVVVAAWVEFAAFRRRMQSRRRVDPIAGKNEAPPV